MFDRTRRYFKILNKKECHNGFQYKTGLNVDTVPFNDNPEESCCKGGLYFTSAESIFAFIEYGPWVREVTIPEDAKVVKDPKSPEKYRANKIILGERFDWTTKEGIERLIKAGVNVHAKNDEALRNTSLYGHTETVKVLLKAGADLNTWGGEALIKASHRNHKETVKLLLDHGADIHMTEDEALRWSSLYGYIEIVKLLLEHGADVHSRDNAALRNASLNDHTEIVELLKQYM